MKYKVGDRVKIVDDLADKEKYPNVNINGMSHWAGSIMTIKEVRSNYYKMEEDVVEFSGWNWHEDMIACKVGKGNKVCDSKYRVIFRNPATILFVYGEKYVSKAHDEPFDKEKGLLMCLAKANGISHLELKRLIKNAEEQGK